MECGLCGGEVVWVSRSGPGEITKCKKCGEIDTQTVDEYDFGIDENPNEMNDIED